MTDLCYNCGSCHLPQPCPMTLVTCHICHNLGHSWNFCHRGALQFNAEYRYFALCHNCDAWHLPDPCKRDEVHCCTCDSLGHLPFYCPIDPLRRNGSKSTSISEDEPGSKRKRMIKDEADQTPLIAPKVVINPREMICSAELADEVYKLKMNTVKDVLDLANHSRPQETFAYLAQVYLGGQSAQQQQHQQLATPTPRAPVTAPITAWESIRSLAATQTMPATFHDNIGSFRLGQNGGSPAVQGNFAHQQQQQSLYQQTPQSQIYYHQDQAREEQPRYQSAQAIKNGEPSDGNGYSLGSDRGRQEQPRIAAAGDGGADIVPSVENTSHGMHQGQIVLPYTSETIQPTSITLGSQTGDVSQTHAGGGSPKAAASKRGGRKATGTRAPRKTAATKAKEVAALAESQALQAQALQAQTQQAQLQVQQAQAQIQQNGQQNGDGEAQEAMSGGASA